MNTPRPPLLPAEEFLLDARIDDLKRGMATIQAYSPQRVKARYRWKQAMRPAPNSRSTI